MPAAACAAARTAATLCKHSQNSVGHIAKAAAVLGNHPAATASKGFARWYAAAAAAAAAIEAHQ